MDLFIYSDESGVFDPKHFNVFVFGGLIFLSKKEKDAAQRRYSATERKTREKLRLNEKKEIKASHLPYPQKNRMYLSMDSDIKFGAVIDLKHVLNQIYDEKKTKQRYQDYAFKICLKKALQSLIKRKVINPDKVKAIHLWTDEHSTATNGLYELQETLLAEFKYGTFTKSYKSFFNPLFPYLTTVDLHYSNSSTTRLVRGADIIANHFLYLARTKGKIDEKNHHVYVTYLP
jgi:hypothetical protein